METCVDFEPAYFKQLAGLILYYDYDNYLPSDSLWTGLRYSFQSLLELNRKYGAVHYMPESWQSVWSNPMLYRLRADALWGATESFEDLLAFHCRQYYGKAASQMTDYLLTLDAAFRRGRAEMNSRPIQNKDIVYCPELTLDDLEAVRPLLDEARKLVEGDPRMEKRIDWVIFAHDQTIQAVITNRQKIDHLCQIVGPKAYQESRELAEKYNFRLPDLVKSAKLA